MHQQRFENYKSMDRFDKYFQIKSNDLSPARGRLLVSEPLMGDYYFGRSVILLADHNDEGTFGVIINKPINQPFNKIVPHFPKFEGSLHLGGPVESNALFYIHSYGEVIEDSVPIGGGLYWGGSIEMIKELIQFGQLTPEKICFYAGYSGWSPKQLDAELKRNSWLVTPMPRHNLLTSNPTTMWKDLLEPMGNEYQHWTKFPKDPGLN